MQRGGVKERTESQGLKRQGRGQVKEERDEGLRREERRG